MAGQSVEDCAESLNKALLQNRADEAHSYAMAMEAASSSYRELVFTEQNIEEDE